MGFVYIIVGALVVIAIWSLADQVRLARHRGISRESFIDEFRIENIPPEIPAAVYDHYKSLSRAEKFSVAPDDSFEKVFRECHEDIDDKAEELARKLNIDLPIEMVLKEWPTPLRTLRDMVLWLNWVRQRQVRPNGTT
jgi:hypothetical protein